MNFGVKIRTYRKNAGLSQEQLAEKLCVSRQAITKWESGKGMPDIENLQRLSILFGVNIDQLLDCEAHIDRAVIREAISLDRYNYRRSIGGRWNKKAGKKDLIVMEKYPGAEIHCLIGKPAATKGETIADHAITFLTAATGAAPLAGIPDFLNEIKHTDKEFYLVTDDGKQFFVVVTDTYMESRHLAEKITAKTFELGNFQFTDCGVIPGRK